VSTANGLDLNGLDANGLDANGLDINDRARCATMARWLEASSVIAALALCCAVITALGYAVHAWRNETLGFALLALVLTPLERYLALRLRFDAGLFADLASGRIADLAALDDGLAMLGVGKRAQPPRSLDERLAGGRRLWRWHAGVGILLAASTAIAVVFA
jgi:hypothetical protein